MKRAVVVFLAQLRVRLIAVLARVSERVGAAQQVERVKRNVRVFATRHQELKAVLVALLAEKDAIAHHLGEVSVQELLEVRTLLLAGLRVAHLLPTRVLLANLKLVEIESVRL